MRESVVSMRIVCVVNFYLLHKWAFSVGENRDIQKVTGEGRVNKLTCRDDEQVNSIREVLQNEFRYDYFSERSS